MRPMTKRDEDNFVAHCRRVFIDLSIDEAYEVFEEWCVLEGIDCFPYPWGLAVGRVIEYYKEIEREDRG